MVDLCDRRLLARRRPHPLGPLLAVFDATEEETSFRVGAAGDPAPVPALDKPTGALVATADEEVPLAPYRARWLVQQSGPKQATSPS